LQEALTINRKLHVAKKHVAKKHVAKKHDGRKLLPSGPAPTTPIGRVPRITLLLASVTPAIA
jgi:hypothetical protein